MDFISDDQMRKFEAEGKVKPIALRPSQDFISDDEMAHLEKKGHTTSMADMDVLDLEGASQASLEHFGNAASLGYLPQLQALTEKPMANLLDSITGKHVAEDLPSYVERRDENLRRLGQESKAHPTASTLGSVGGAISSGIGTSALAPVKAASLLGRAAQAAGSGSVLGALANPGDTEGTIDPTQFDARIENAKTGAKWGALGQATGEGLSKALETAAKVPGFLKNLAETKAFKASGAMLKDFRKAEGQEKLNELGRRMLDSGLIKPGYTYDDIAEVAGRLKGNQGKEIGKIIDQADEITGSLGNFDAEAAANELKKKLMPNLDSAIGGSAEATKVQSYLDDLASRGNSIGTKELQNIKQSTDKLFNEKDWFTEGKPAKEALKAIRGRLKNAIEDKADLMDSFVNDGMGGKLKEANRAWGDLSEIEKIASDRVSRENANRMFGLTDYKAGLGGIGLGAATGIAEGNPDKAVKNALIGAALGGIGNKIARNYGNPILAMTADKTAKILADNPNLLGRFAQPLVEAAKKGPSAFGSTIYVLSKDPKFQKQIGNGSPEQLLQQPSYMQLFKQNPQLIDTLKNEKLKQVLRKQFDRNPTGEQSIPSQKLIPDDQAKKQFIQGN